MGQKRKIQDNLPDTEVSGVSDYSDVEGFDIHELPPPKNARLAVDMQAVSLCKLSEKNVIRSEKYGLSVIGLRKGETICFQGYALVSAVLGSANISGYNMTSLHGVTENTLSLDSIIPFYPVYSPKSHPLAIIESIAHALTSKSKPSTVECVIPSGEILRVESSSRLYEEISHLVESLKNTGRLFLDTMIAVLDLSFCGIVGIESMNPLYKDLFTPDYLHNKEDPNTKAITMIGVDGFFPIVRPTPGVSALSLPESWFANVDSLLSKSTLQTDKKSAPIILTFGNRNVGKSTFSRFLVNFLLNEYPKVAFLECDVGQSEFTSPGLVSLNIVSTPLLGPPYTHQHQPYRTAFIGSTSPKNDPDYYISCISSLLKAYQGLIPTTWESEGTLIPLVINTQGWIKGMGEDLLVNILQLSRPTHVYHILPSNATIPPADSSVLLSVQSTLRSLKLESPELDPQFSYFMGVTKDVKPKLSATDLRHLSLLLHLHRTHNHNILTVPLSPSLSRPLPWYDFTPLSHYSPYIYKLPWKNYHFKILGTDVPYSDILYALNGTVVALLEEDLEATTFQPPPISSSEQSKTFDQYPRYLPPSATLSIPPLNTSHKFHSFGLIHSISPATQEIILYCPHPIEELKRVNTIVRGTDIDLPAWEIVRGIDGLVGGEFGHTKSKHSVPYISFKSGEGMGAQTMRVRRNLLRRKLHA
ncbi:hypothetical protein BKA69DRAFT_1122321 [Paraphysoderma sedebokerense]|nr:hypothetical protein BKA69DRAFT_1122321 [Paraphysoderma sedebokerense]